VLVFAGFAFKTASVPFHFWCPDAYEGAPTVVAGLLSVAPKAAGFVAMLRFFTDLPGVVDWTPLLAVVSVATMTVGNVAALTQTNMKRLLAYSSIAHAGYLMMGVVAFSEEGVRGLLLYLVVYVFMNLGAFFVVSLVHEQDGSFELADYAGLWRRAPGLTAAMAVFLLSLMGIPPLAGFMGKLYVFAAVMDRGPAYYAYAVIAALNTAVAVYYYARVLKAMVVDPEAVERPAFPLALPDALSLGALALANFLPLLAWSAVDGWARAATQIAAR
jgi:NADH-quinone oxidoreductase subunit N